MDRVQRRKLKQQLTTHVPWLVSPDTGPTTVDAANCDRCDRLPRLMATCGPIKWRALCRDCAVEIGTSGWCEGHRHHAKKLLQWAAELPPWWGDAVVLWWVSTGEVKAPPASVDAALPPAVRAALPRAGRG